MKNQQRRKLCIALCALAAFVLWTAAVLFIDVQKTGPLESSIGLASVNHFVHKLTGVHMPLYTATDWLGLVPIAFASGFALLGLMQWCRRKSLFRVDRSILALGVFYIVLLAAYVFFEAFPVNYRPVLIDGRLEASYPSSTTLLTLCAMTTAAMQFNSRIKNRRFSRCLLLIMSAFTCLMVLARLISGVHWFSDIIGGILLGTALIMLYASATTGP